MTKEYAFEFIGEKEEFLNILNAYPNNTSYSDDRFYYFDNFIVKVVDDKIHFGVERGGHSGGYWYIPSITECDGRIEFCGVIKYIGPDDDRGKISKTIDVIEYVLLFILVIPIVMLIGLYRLVDWVIRKMLKRPKPRAKTTEEKLFDLMENYLGCVRKD